ncbi:hypothetical protein PT974_05483 [Cladobotryum mycophilum]|uniref:Rhodopsin domain-containing protein n=1 Tax=Cladobotryum mycophilum TaxID=491253 RepID=A0ABR0SJZ2_9HYPO
MSNSSTGGGMPAFPPPDNPNDLGRGPLILGLTWALTSLCIVLIGARFFVRIKILRALSSDDWFILAAGIFQIAFQACITEAYNWGLGKRDKNLTFDPQLVNILKWNWISTTLAILVSILTRISAVILLVRIFGTKVWLKWFLIVFTTLQSIVASLVIIFVWVQVSPVEGLWNPLLPARRWDTRVQQYSAYFGQSLFSLSDLTYVLFPVIIIWSFNMPLRRKIGLVILMAMSLLAMVASIMKTVTSRTTSGKTLDVQYNSSLTILWSAIEQSLVIMMSCVPPLRAITGMDFSLLSLTGRASSKNTGSKGPSTFGAYRGTPPYRDLEMNSPRFGSFDKDTNRAVSITHVKVGRNSRSLQPSGSIRRTDQFIVTYGEKVEVEKEMRA